MCLCWQVYKKLCFTKTLFHPVEQASNGLCPVVFVMFTRIHKPKVCAKLIPVCVCQWVHPSVFLFLFKDFRSSDSKTVLNKQTHTQTWSVQLKFYCQGIVKHFSATNFCCFFFLLPGYGPNQPKSSVNCELSYSVLQLF